MPTDWLERLAKQAANVAPLMSPPASFFDPEPAIAKPGNGAGMGTARPSVQTGQGNLKTAPSGPVAALKPKSYTDSPPNASMPFIAAPQSSGNAQPVTVGAHLALNSSTTPINRVPLQPVSQLREIPPLAQKPRVMAPPASSSGLTLAQQQLKNTLGWQAGHPVYDNNRLEYQAKGVAPAEIDRLMIDQFQTETRRQLAETHNMRPGDVPDAWVAEMAAAHARQATPNMSRDLGSPAATGLADLVGSHYLGQYASKTLPWGKQLGGTAGVVGVPLISDTLNRSNLLPWQLGGNVGGPMTNRVSADQRLEFAHNQAALSQQALRYQPRTTKEMVGGIAGEMMPWTRYLPGGYATPTTPVGEMTTSSFLEGTQPFANPISYPGGLLDASSRAQTPQDRANAQQAAAHSVAMLQQQLASGIKSNGLPYTGAERAQLQAMLQQATSNAQQAEQHQQRFQQQTQPDTARGQYYGHY